MTVAASSPEPSPFSAAPDGAELADGAELVLEQFDEPTENTPITAVHPWQRIAPPPLPQSDDG